MKKTILTILTSTVLALGSAQADIVFGNLGADGAAATGPTGGRNIATGSWSAIGFTTAAAAFDLNTVSFAFSTLGNTTIVMDLYSNSGGNPGSFITRLGTEVIPLGTSYTNQRIDFTPNYGLSASTSYWLVGRATAGNGGTWIKNTANTIAGDQNSSGWTALGVKQTSTSGAGWATSTGNASYISLSVDASNPIPEPGTWAAMAIFAGGAAYAGWRRRQQQLA